MLSVTAIPAFSDNYIWLIENDRKQAVIVDPGDAAPVLEFLEHQRLQLAAILVTHHHHDHTDGIAALVAQHPNTPVYGPANSPFLGITHPLEDGDRFKLLNHQCQVIATPGHTQDHICYLLGHRLFCGDTLFSAGCGRLFEAPDAMYDSLLKLKALHDDTAIYCAHEYTLSNLRFAQAVEPNNLAIRNHLEKISQWRQNNRCSLPSSMALEREINPFLRCDIAAVHTAVSDSVSKFDEQSVFRALRHWKDVF
ncbi:Hydroxyacylglutathione hydrolase GloB [Vibrio stylophorae]|uniref:Hydroxyacylglutathione hydrolase n=1 Tax=Vibrio stylophorae TaxID=659351 RepID=A0ABM8ZVZ5_9VIBR|nr:hydroxyacylglutathione hydrolase [Vibrio stylophorae]CAH0534198.1 Hydroxyacylglutathione hydrolase GloB [Vibrio stylophorae]